MLLGLGVVVVEDGLRERRVLQQRRRAPRRLPLLAPGHHVQLGLLEDHRSADRDGPGDDRADDVELDELERDALLEERLRELARVLDPEADGAPEAFGSVRVRCDHAPDQLHPRRVGCLVWLQRDHLIQDDGVLHRSTAVGNRLLVQLVHGNLHAELAVVVVEPLDPGVVARASQRKQCPSNLRALLRILHGSFRDHVEDDDEDQPNDTNHHTHGH
mmetsp:Transcript_17266/g.41857  ORF Transcript_17266/g.41857 Transcript_17266/m.41857 type:complete len:216 (-) Transcript_17266:1062-1709(-)